MFWVSGSENGLGPRYTSLLLLRLGPPHNVDEPLQEDADHRSSWRWVFLDMVGPLVPGRGSSQTL